MGPTWPIPFLPKFFAFVSWALQPSLEVHPPPLPILLLSLLSSRSSLLSLPSSPREAVRTAPHPGAAARPTPDDRAPRPSRPRCQQSHPCAATASTLHAPRAPLALAAPATDARNPSLRTRRRDACSSSCNEV
jgi:hypothetical protein